MRGIDYAYPPSLRWTRVCQAALAIHVLGSNPPQYCPGVAMDPETLLRYSIFVVMLERESVP